MENKFILQMKDINKSFPGVKALDNAQLNLRPGTVHALMGENGAGKSTLMKCLFGIYNKDSGTILLDGKEVNYKNPKDAMEHGVAMVHQELNQVLKRDVMDNIWLGRFPTTGKVFTSQKKMKEKTKALLDDLGIDVEPTTILGKLTIAKRQLLEIAKAVSYNSKIIVLDEPTSSLTTKEVEHLFKIINRLRDNGVGIIYISHKMDEILRISDEVTVMRDGKYISTDKAADLKIEDIIKKMVGRELTNVYPKKDFKPIDEVILKINNLNRKIQPFLKDVNFTLKKGEILGFAGLVGAGRTETAECIFGDRYSDSIEIEKNGKKIVNKNPKKAIKNGFALLTEERRATGIFAVLNIVENSIISNIDSYREKTGLLNNKKMLKDTKWVIDSMKVKTPSHKTKIKNLSGGNQQKVIIGRWLLSQPDILILDEPTRGIDVGAKYEIYQLIIELAREGKGIIMISSEMAELMGVCDRIVVMSGGQIAGEVDGPTSTQEEIMALAAKYV